jgi:hypothetical protein
MTPEQLNKYLAFLDKHGVNYSKDVILVNSSHLSIICNANYEPKEFQGTCGFNVVELVAKELGKKVEWMDESY